MVTTQAFANIFDHFDRNLLTPYAVGFDRVFDRTNNYVVHQNHMTPTGLPPYNIRKDGDYKFDIELALARLSKDDLEVEVTEGRPDCPWLLTRRKTKVSSYIVAFLFASSHAAGH